MSNCPPTTWNEVARPLVERTDSGVWPAETLRALQEAGLPFDTADELAAMTEDVYLPQLPPDEFPYLNESAAALVAAGYDPAEEFTFGLDLVLAALEARRAPA